MGQPGTLHRVSSPVECISRRSQPGEVKHLSTLRKRKSHSIPLVVASERGTAQTGGIKARVRSLIGVVGVRWIGGTSPVGKLQNSLEAERSGKVGHRR